MNIEKKIDYPVVRLMIILNITIEPHPTTDGETMTHVGVLN